MKTKIIITESILLGICIVGIIYLFQANNSSKYQLIAADNDMESLQNQLSDLAVDTDNKISEYEATISALETNIEDFKNANGELESTVSQLELTISELEKQIDTQQAESKEEFTPQQPKQQSSSKTQNTTETKQPAESSQNSTSSSNKSLDEKLAELGLPPQQDMPTAERNTNIDYWGGDGITAQ